MIKSLKSIIKKSINNSIKPKTMKKDFKSDLPIYDALKNYQLKGILGDGAFSIVYEAYDLKNQKSVAIKIAPKGQLGPKEITGIRNEALILRNCDHPNIVKLYEFIETQDHFFLIQEMVEGGELFDKIISMVYFSEPLTRHVIKEIANGIKYLHEKGVVHRDIKPENILLEKIPIINSLDKNGTMGKSGEGAIIENVGGAGIGRVKIADFGLSKILPKNKSYTQTPCGTMGYTAPEIMNTKNYGLEVDLWALGCVLYTMLCGFPPFYDDDIHVLSEKVACGHFSFLSPWWDEISDSAKDLVSKLLTVDPSSRLTIQEVFRHPWFASTTTELEKNMARCSIATPLSNSVSLKEAFDVSYAVNRLADNAIINQNKKEKYNKEDVFSRGNIDSLTNFNLNLKDSSLLCKRKNHLKVT